MERSKGNNALIVRQLCAPLKDEHDLSARLLTASDPLYGKTFKELIRGIRRWHHVGYRPQAEPPMRANRGRRLREYRHFEEVPAPQDALIKGRKCAG
ncbi:MAG TPA: hypothetical protein PLN31_20485 [Azoarcus taiwanensis]|nr:hypothetical protein [Azoarcus taiwanensis]